MLIFILILMLKFINRYSLIYKQIHYFTLKIKFWDWKEQINRIK